MYNYIELQRLATKSLKPSISKDYNPQIVIVINKKVSQKHEFLKQCFIGRVFKNKYFTFWFRR